MIGYVKGPHKKRVSNPMRASFTKEGYTIDKYYTNYIHPQFYLFIFIEDTLKYSYIKLKACLQKKILKL